MRSPTILAALAALAALLAPLTPAAARTLYVAPAGSDAADGTTLAHAFRTLQKAADTVAPGDTVLIAGGTYADPLGTTGGALLQLRTSGRPDAWITWRALPGQTPDLRTRRWAAIEIDASYQILDGLTVTGANDALVLADAIEDGRKPAASALYNSNGILIEGRHSAPDAKPHHIVIRHCDVADMPGGGIAGLETDYVTIEDNKVHDNAWYMRYGGSGITLLDDWAQDDRPGYHIVIQRNLVWNNKTFVPWERTGKLSDGNGILLDVTDPEDSGPGDAAGATNPNGDAIVQPEQPQSGARPRRPLWAGRALIADNVSAFNGGSGIHTFRTAHVDIVRNTTYWNGGYVGYEELFANRSRDVTIQHNIIVPRPDGRVTSDHNNAVRWDYNRYPEAQTVMRGPHDVVGPIAFVRVDRDLRRADFRVKAAGGAAAPAR